MDSKGSVTISNDSASILKLRNHLSRMHRMHLSINADFVDYMPSKIAELSWNPSSSKINLFSIARGENGLIEIWNPKGGEWLSG